MKYNMYVITEFRNKLYHAQYIFVTQKGFVEYMACRANALVPGERTGVVNLDVNIVYDIECSDDDYARILKVTGDVSGE